MSTADEWARHQYREKIDGPGRWAAQNLGLLHLIWEKFDTEGEWPSAKPLQRELFGTEHEFDVNELARAMPPQLGRFDTQFGKILLTPRALSFVPAAAPLLDRFAVLVGIAVTRYADRASDPIIDSSEFEALLHIDARRAGQLTEILMLDPWLLRPAGGGTDGEPQLFEIDESVVRRVRDVKSIADYLDAQFSAWYPMPDADTGVQSALYQPQADAEALAAYEPARDSGSELTAEMATVDAAAAIFLVHGHATERLHEVARFIESASQHEVVILHEQPNQGQTLIEKFESNAAKAAHAVVLLTADDVGRAAAAREAETRRRGRQNVVLELGFFLGKLGRAHVTVLEDPDVEEPSDITGIVYITLDAAGSWKSQLTRELAASGIDINMDRLEGRLKEIDAELDALTVRQIQARTSRVSASTRATTALILSVALIVLAAVLGSILPNGWKTVVGVAAPVVIALALTILTFARWVPGLRQGMFGVEANRLQRQVEALGEERRTIVASVVSTSSRRIIDPVTSVRPPATRGEEAGPDV